MQAMDDMALLREYTAHNSEAAFEQLVSRRVNFVYSAARRQVRDPQMAEEITQAVFIILAQKAGNISSKTILTGWLFKTARYVALAQRRAAAKRRRREQEAQMQSELLEPSMPDPLWEQMSPLLDEALARLGESDRQAVLLRFFDNKSLAEVGNSLGTGEDTARKRVARALEKLHRYFSKRGISSTTTIISGAISLHSVQAAPAALADTATAVAIAKGATASGPTLALIKGALKLMAWTKAKAAVVVGMGILIVAGTTAIMSTTLAQKSNSSSSDPIDALYQKLLAHPYDIARTFLQAPQLFLVRPTHYTNDSETTGGISTSNLAFGVNVNIPWLIEFAYDWPLDWAQTRMVLPDTMPEGNYDLMATLPGRQNAMALQAELKKQFGLIAHREMRETNVFVLAVEDTIRLQSHLSRKGEPSASMTWNSKTYSFPFKHETLADVGKGLEKAIGAPIIDQSELTNRFDLNFQWDTKSSPEHVQASVREQLHQFGLELMPSNAPVETLVVEKVK